MRTKREDVKSGNVYGRWRVLDFCIRTTTGEKKWLCRCECGTERYVLERALKYGESKSCGCLQRENAGRAVRDLTGQTFGALTVLYVLEKKGANRGVRWRCQCECGNTYDVLASLLTTGKRTHCGNRKAHRRKCAPADTAQTK